MESANKNIATITKKNGMKYTIRQDKNRYFFPDEWKSFIETFSDQKQQLLFNTLLFTGARIMEALHIKPSSFDMNKEIITLTVVKHRAANKKLKKSPFSSGIKRQFFICNRYAKMVKKYVKEHNIKEEDYFFLDADKLPSNYESLNNEEKKKYYRGKETSYYILFKSHLKKAGIRDYEDLSLHSIRKTYGMWMRLYIKDIGDLAYRMGHDPETYWNNYGSNLLFDEKDKIKINGVLGDVK